MAKSLSQGSSMDWVFNIFSDNGWICKNSENFHAAKCYKIMTVDPKDDLILTPASIMMGVC